MTLQKNKLLNWFLVFALSLTALDCFSHSRSESYSKINVLSNDNFYQVNLSANISNTILNNFLRQQGLKIEENPVPGLERSGFSGGIKLILVK